MANRSDKAEIEKLAKMVSGSIKAKAKAELRPEPRTAQRASPTPEVMPAIDPALLRRSKPKKEPEPEPKKVELTSGAIDKIVDLALNPSRETIRGFTNIDRIQGRLLPQLDIIDVVWQYLIDIATHRESPVTMPIHNRQDAEEFEQLMKQRERPPTPNLIELFTFRTAQWQKSVQGKSLQSAIDLALAETETRSDDGDLLGGHGNFED